METNVRQVMDLLVADVVRVYAGKAGCGCGCRGKYWTDARNIQRVVMEMKGRVAETALGGKMVYDPALRAGVKDGIAFVETERRYLWAYLKEAEPAGASPAKCSCKKCLGPKVGRDGDCSVAVAAATEEVEAYEGFQRRVAESAAEGERLDALLAKDQKTVEQLGDKFAELLAKDLTADQLAEVRRRNAAEDNPSVCHSHDFVDANEVMAEAFVAVIGRETEDDGDFNFWNRAWAYAKSAHLTSDERGGR